MVSKVIGRRGERVLRVVEMRQDEELSEEGRVMRKGTTGTEENRIEHHKRKDRSPGGSPNNSKTRRFGGMGDLYWTIPAKKLRMEEKITM